VAAVPGQTFGETFLIEGKPAYLGGFAKALFADMARRAGLPEVARTGIPSPRTPPMSAADCAKSSTGLA
jgi:hypothetical protein